MKATDQKNKQNEFLVYFTVILYFLSFILHANQSFSEKFYLIILIGANAGMILILIRALQYRQNNPQIIPSRKVSIVCRKVRCPNCGNEIDLNHTERRLYLSRFELTCSYCQIVLQTNARKSLNAAWVLLAFCMVFVPIVLAIPKKMGGWAMVIGIFVIFPLLIKFILFQAFPQLEVKKDE